MGGERYRPWTLLDELREEERAKVCARCARYERLTDRIGVCRDRVWVYHTSPDSRCARFTLKQRKPPQVRRDATCEGCKRLMKKEGREVWVCKFGKELRHAWNGFPGRRCDDFEREYK